MILSRSLDLTPTSAAILFGRLLKYQMWTTGTDSVMCPARSRRTDFWVTSTPQRSQTMPL